MTTVVTSARERVLEVWPFAVAHRNEKHSDYAIFTSGYSLDCIGYGTTESDAWRNADARLKEKRAMVGRAASA